LDGQVPENGIPVAEIQTLGRKSDEDSLTARRDPGDGGNLALEFPQPGPAGQPLQNMGAVLGLAAEPPHGVGPAAHRPATRGASFGPGCRLGDAARATSGGVDSKMATLGRSKHREKLPLLQFSRYFGPDSALGT
jgi:hypothetical protein